MNYYLIFEDNCYVLIQKNSDVALEISKRKPLEAYIYIIQDDSFTEKIKNKEYIFVELTNKKLWYIALRRAIIYNSLLKKHFKHNGRK